MTSTSFTQAGSASSSAFQPLGGPGQVASNDHATQDKLSNLLTPVPTSLPHVAADPGQSVTITLEDLRTALRGAIQDIAPDAPSARRQTLSSGHVLGFKTQKNTAAVTPGYSAFACTYRLCC